MDDPAGTHSLVGLLYSGFITIELTPSPLGVGRIERSL